MSTAVQPFLCSGCRAEIDATFLACPLCQRLVHSAELTRIASQARQAEAAGDLTTSLGAWRKALELLPLGTSQHKTVETEMRRLSSTLDGRARPRQNGAPREAGGKKAGFVAGAGALGAAALANGKLLLLGLFKLPTLLTMVGYATLTGGRGVGVAVGIVAAIYVHEVGHVATLRRYGIEASAPMFIPGFGAIVRMRQYPTDAHEEARTGLAGPLWGLFASGLALALGLLLHSQTAFVVAWWSATINASNLIRVWQLDGARGLKALSARERLMVGALGLVAALLTREWMPCVVGAVILGRAAFPGAHPEGDRRVFWLFAALVGLHPAVARLASLLGGV